MNKKEYLNKLKLELKKRSVTNISDIIADYDELIEIKIREGKSEIEAINELGSIEELANAYGEKSKIPGEKNIYKFILLQVFNVLFGFAIVFSLIAVALSFVAVIFAFVITGIFGVVQLVQGDFSTLPTIFLALTIVVTTFFGIGIMIMLIKILYIGIYNYVIININTIKENKLTYKRLRIKKIIVIATAASFVLMVVFGTISAITGYGEYKTTAVEVIDNFSYNSINDEYNIQDNMKVLEVEGVNVEIRSGYGTGNSVIANSKVSIEETSEKTVIKANDSSNKHTDLIDKYVFSPTIIVTINNDLEELIVDGVNVEIDNVLAVNNTINGINTEVDVIKNQDVKELIVNSTNTDINLERTNVENVNVKGKNIDSSFDRSIIGNITADGINSSIELDRAEVSVVDITKNTTVELSLERSIINELLGKSITTNIDKDLNSEIRALK